LDNVFFYKAPEASVIADNDGKILMANEKIKEIFGEIIEEKNYLYNVNFLNSNSENIFDPSIIKSYFEFEFENREITYKKPEGFILYFLLSQKKIDIDENKYLFLSFKNVTDFVSYKKIFEELYDSLTTKTIELDTVIIEKEKAYKLLKQKDDEMLRQLNLAREVQKGIFPEINETINNFSLYSRLKAASIVSGDFFSVWKTEDRYIDFIIADVTGHGVPSALITMMLKMSLQTRIAEYKTPEDILEAVKNDMHGILSNATIFVTLIFARIDTNNGNISILDCGHTPPIILKNNGEVKVVDINGMMLGVIDELDMGNVDTNIEKGDMIIFITDGIIEAQNQEGEFYEKYFYEKLKKIYKESPETIVDETIFDLYKFVNKEEFSDDATIVCVKRI